MTPTQPSLDPHPLNDELDGLHEPMDAPVSLRKPSAAYVVLLVAQDAGVPMAIAMQWLCNMRFEDSL